jgi:hypothetical protein
MSTSIPHTLQRPSWSIQSIIDPAYAKLGALLKDIDQLGRGGSMNTRRVRRSPFPKNIWATADFPSRPARPIS